MIQRRHRYLHVFLKQKYGHDFITRALIFERKAKNLISRYYKVNELPRYIVTETQI